IVILEQALFAPRRIWASRAKRRVLRDAISHAGLASLSNCANTQILYALQLKCYTSTGKSAKDGLRCLFSVGVDKAKRFWPTNDLGLRKPAPLRRAGDYDDDKRKPNAKCGQPTARGKWAGNSSCHDWRNVGVGLLRKPGKG